MKLPENRWGRGLEDISDEDIVGIIFALIVKMKDPRLITHVAAAAAVCLATVLDRPIQEIFAALANAVDNWTVEETAERRAMLVSTGDQFEAGFQEFKERVYREGVDPYEA